MESRISILAALLAACSFTASASTNQPRLVESFADRADTQVRPYKSFADRADTQVRPYESFAVNLSFLGANPSPEIVGEDALPAKTNYFIGNDPAKWRTNVPNYGKVRLKNLYDGVDLVYYGNQQKVKYEFVVEPGGKTHSDFCLRMIPLTVQSYFVITRSRI